MVRFWLSGGWMSGDGVDEEKKIPLEGEAIGIGIGIGTKICRL
jgi:hypothetical protein